MKLFPSLTLAALCAAFAGCTATTQTIRFVPTGAPESENVTVSVDGNVIGVAPLSYTVTRTSSPVSLSVAFSKDGYETDTGLVESYIDADGLCTFIDEVPVPELLEKDASAAEPEPAPAVVAVAEEPEPVPAVAEVPPEPAADEAPEEPAPAAVADVPADGADVVVEEETVEPVPEPAAAPEPAPVPPPAEVSPAPAEPESQSAPEVALDPNRTLKDIERDLATLSAQRQNGSLSEKEFQDACAALEREIRARYGK